MMMKNLLSISALLFIALVSICADCGDTLRSYRYTVKNESGQPIRVKGYKSYNINFPPTVTNLKVGEVLTKTYESQRGSYDFSHFFGEEGTHYPRGWIVVIYAGQKYSSFTLGSAGPRNPLNVSYYRDEEETFIFTEEDYQRAEDCDNNC